MTDEETVRLSVEISRATNEKLKMFLPWGIKTEVIRALIDCLVNTQTENPGYLAQDLIRGKCRLVVVQNLNKSGSIGDEETS